MATSIKEAFKKAAIAAFVAVGDVKRSVTFRSMTASTGYSPTTGVATEIYTDYSVDMIMTRVKAEEVGNGIIQTNDRWAMIPQYNLTPTPKINDIIVESSAEWQIVQILDDGADALWRFLVRKA